MTRVAIIGAGAAGLCAGKNLSGKGMDFTIYEAASTVGGLWVYDSDSGMSPAYKSLHLNSEAKVTAYRDFPFPEGTPLYPDHAQVHRYLKAYAKTHDLEKHIRFRVTVSKVEKDADGTWRVTCADGTSETYDAVIVASGHQSVPRHPEWKDDFTGEYLHAHSYRVPDPFRDKDVLVVGMGNSAVDIAADICVVTKSTTLCARSPVLVMPRMMFGVPMSRILAKVEKPWIPWGIKRRVREILTWAVSGRMEQWGFTTPKTRTHATTHPSLMQHFIWHRITAKPGMQAVEGRKVTYVDGTVAEYDTIIAATGYDYTVPFLSDDHQPTRDGRMALYLRVVPPQETGLFFVGFFNVNGGGNIRMMDDQAEWVADMLSGEAPRPDPQQMRDGLNRELDFLARRYPGSIRYAFELEPKVYMKWLAESRARSQSDAGKTTT